MTLPVVTSHPATAAGAMQEPGGRAPAVPGSTLPARISAKSRRRRRTRSGTHLGPDRCGSPGQQEIDHARGRVAVVVVAERRAERPVTLLVCGGHAVEAPQRPGDLVARAQDRAP